LVLEVIRDQLVSLDYRDHKETPGLRDSQEISETSAILVFQAFLETRGELVRRDFQDQPVALALQDQSVLQATQEIMGLQDHRDHEDQVGQMDPSVQ